MKSYNLDTFETKTFGVPNSTQVELGFDPILILVSESAWLQLEEARKESKKMRALKHR